MSQANDVARRRHIGCYRSRNDPDAAKCETHHDIAAAEGIPISLRPHWTRTGVQKTANGVRVS